MKDNLNIQDWKDKNVCEPLGEACQAQNSTFNGRIFSSPTPCSCCNICLENLKYGDDCTVGAPGFPIPTSICGPGLECRDDPESEHTKCLQSKY